MSSIPRFEINGVVDTSKTVMSNLNDLCNACGSWLTFDSNTGLWSVVINKPGNSVKSFTDKNIIGSINVSGSGIAELYNGVSIQFPNKDLRDQTDFVEYSIPEDQRFPNEYDNTLEMSLKYTTDPIQASYLGRVELKQSRFDKIIEFATDYTGLGLKAGDIIDVTATMYGFNQKLFRVTKAQEADTDDGGIQISITALEYDPSVYDEDGLLRIERNKKTGIVPKSMNTALTEADAKATTDATLKELMDRLDGLQIPGYKTFTVGASASDVQTVYNNYAGTSPWGTGFNGNLNALVDVIFQTTSRTDNFKIECFTPFGMFDYRYKFVDNVIRDRLDIRAYLPTTYILSVYVNGAWQMIDFTTADWQTQNVSFVVTNKPATQYKISIYPLLTYDMAQIQTHAIFPFNYRVDPQTSGYGFTVVGTIFNVAEPV